MNDKTTTAHAPEDFYTHQRAWRDAIVGMMNLAKPAGVDHDDRAYWEHELKAFDRAYAELAAGAHLTPGSSIAASEADLDKAAEQAIESVAATLGPFASDIDMDFRTHTALRHALVRAGMALAVQLAASVPARAAADPTFAPIVGGSAG